MENYGSTRDYYLYADQSARHQCQNHPQFETQQIYHLIHYGKTVPDFELSGRERRGVYKRCMNKERSNRSFSFVLYFLKKFRNSLDKCPIILYNTPVVGKDRWHMALWCSRLARQPVTLEVDGSSPFGVANKKTPSFWMVFFYWQF